MSKLSFRFDFLISSQANCSALALAYRGLTCNLFRESLMDFRFVACLQLSSVKILGMCAVPGFCGPGDQARALWFAVYQPSSSLALKGLVFFLTSFPHFASELMSLACVLSEYPRDYHEARLWFYVLWLGIVSPA